SIVGFAYAHRLGERAAYAWNAELSIRVLLVEDDHAIVRALTDLLEGEGFAVRSCATQDGACAALATDDFDIALLDVTLAQGNGFAVCAAAREAAPDMP
ncbi:response regulator, partial [Adlercreutzia rubneri]|uniref:response regulator n=1 Tax=Adlercreutzia rubneri TaxID=2916441 RepID=UPI0023B0094D